MSRTLNTRAAGFALRYLFLAEPDEGFVAASMSVRDLASVFCVERECEFHNGSAACRKHMRAMVLGVSKMIVAGDVYAELTHRGVLFVRLSPQGVLSPEGWVRPPEWFFRRPELVEWARSRSLEPV